MRYFGRYTVDPSGLVNPVFNSLISFIPKVSGWYGNTVSKVVVQGSLIKAISVSGAVFLAIAKILAEWFAAVKDMQESMFLTGRNPLGNRWVEHVRNTYIDYGLDPDSNGRTWENTNSDLNTYYTRLQSYANELINLFKKQDITVESLKKVITKMLPEGTSVEINEPYKLIKPWPAARLYKPRKLESETSQEYSTRLSLYNLEYKRLNKLSKGTSKAKPNTYYPIPVVSDAPLTSNTTESDSSPQKLERLSLLKTDLGSYTNLGRNGSRVFPSSRHQGGRLEIVISNLQEDGQEVVDVLAQIKPAGVYIDLFSELFLEVASNVDSASFLEIEWSLEFTGVAITSSSAGFIQV